LRSTVDEYEEVVWVGWPGNYCATEADEARMTKRLQEVSSSIQLRPVWLSKDDVEDFYNGFSNSSLWPVLHWMTSCARFRKTWWESYRRVNLKFAEAILSIARPDDIVWVHDYHLFLVPQMLRKLLDYNFGVSSRPSDSFAVRPKDLPPVDVNGDGYEESIRFMSSESFAARADSAAGGENAMSRTPSFQEEAGTTPGPQSKDTKKSVSFSPLDRKAANWDNLKVGFFLHTPFPSFEVMSTLPHCIDIVEGMLGADLVGFHTYNYLRHYRSCVIRLCGFTPEMDMVEHLGRRTRLGVFPIGANCVEIQENMKSDAFREHLQEYTDQFQGKSLVLSVERLDYTKGMPQKLAAIEQYLEEAENVQKERKLQRQQQEVGTPSTIPQEDSEREIRLEELSKKFEERLESKKKNIKLTLRTSFTHLWNKAKAMASDKEEEQELDHTKTVFLFIAVPSRQCVQEYKAIEEEVHRTISTINGRFSTVNHTPILYIHRSISGDELAALYARSDCCLVTPLVDGMNLVAKEFVAAKDRTVENVVPGTIVLSEFAGAAQELFDALVVNPYDVDAVADAIHLGLELTKGDSLDKDSRWEATARMRTVVLQNDAAAWARHNLQELSTDTMAGRRPSLARSTTSILNFTALDFSAKSEGRKAIFLNYDGCFKDKQPEEYSEAYMSQMSAFSDREDLSLFIISGLTKDLVDKYFGRYENFTLVAEHGLLVRPAGEKLWQQMGRDDSVIWMKKVTPLMRLSERCTPLAKVDIRASSLAWHYHDCDEHYGDFKTKELVHQLALSIGNLPCEVCQGDKVVEVKSLHVRNGYAIQELLTEKEKAHGVFTAILVMSDDTTDESMFLGIPKDRAYSVRVGPGDTRAKFRMENWEEAQQYLQLIVSDQQGKERGASDGRFQSCVGPEDRKDSTDTAESLSFFGGLVEET